MGFIILNYLNIDILKPSTNCREVSHLCSLIPVVTVLQFK